MPDIQIYPGPIRGDDTGANAPVEDFSRGNGMVCLLFDDASKQRFVAQIHAPEDMAVTPALRVRGNFSMDTANTGTKGVVIAIRGQAVTPDANESFSTSGWDATQVKDRVVVDNTVDETVSFDIDISTADDGVAADDTFWLEFERTGDDTTTETSGDDATGNMQLESCVLEYTSA